MNFSKKSGKLFVLQELIGTSCRLPGSFFSNNKSNNNNITTQHSNFSNQIYNSLISHLLPIDIGCSTNPKITYKLGFEHFGFQRFLHVFKLVNSAMSYNFFCVNKKEGYFIRDTPCGVSSVQCFFFTLISYFL